MNQKRKHSTKSVDVYETDESNKSILMEFDDIQLNSEPISIDNSPKLIRDARKLFRHLTTNNHHILPMIAVMILVICSIYINKHATYYPNNLSVLCDSCSTGKMRSGKGAMLLSLKGDEDTNSSRGLLSSTLKLYLGDMKDLVRDDDVPLFLHIPRSGGMTIRDIIGSCYGLTLTGDLGKNFKHEYPLKLLENGIKGYSVVNVDTSFQEGIVFAKELKLLESNAADVIATKDLYAAVNTLFVGANRTARAFVMMRHPIDRLVSLFHYLGIAHWDPAYDPDLSYISIEMFARSQRMDNSNYMVRLLSNNKHDEELTETDLHQAKLVLQEKMLIGLLSEKEESFSRFEQYFHWKNSLNSDEEELQICKEKLMTWGWSNKHAHPLIEEGSPAWELLLKKNELDMQLYEYAKFLFTQQGELVKQKSLEAKVRQQQQQQTDHWRPPQSLFEEGEEIRLTNKNHVHLSINDIDEEMNKEESNLKEIQEKHLQFEEKQKL